MFWTTGTLVEAIVSPRDGVDRQDLRDGRQGGAGAGSGVKHLPLSPSARQGPRREEALEPHLTILDSHHHLYPEDSAIHRRYLPEDLDGDLAAGHRVVQTVYVETSGSAYRSGGPVELRPVGETEWVTGMIRSGRGNRISAIIGFADLMLGSKVSAVIDGHAEAADGRFRGVRFRTPVLGQALAPPTFLQEKDMWDGAAVLDRRGLVLEIFADFDQLSSLALLARAMPGLTIVVDHLGVPSAPPPQDVVRRAEALARWRSAIEHVAVCPNVYMKIGGLGMERLTPRSWFPAAPTSEQIARLWHDPVSFVIDSFGAQRCMFESNFPVDGALCDYVTLWNVFKRMTSDRTEADRAQMLALHRRACLSNPRFRRGTTNLGPNGGSSPGCTEGARWSTTRSKFLDLRVWQGSARRMQACGISG